MFARFVNIKSKSVFGCALFIAGFLWSIVREGRTFDIVFALAALLSAIVLFVLARSSRMYFRAGALFLAVLALGTCFGLAAKLVYFYPSQEFLCENENKECELLLRIDKTDSYGENYANYNCSVLSCNGKSVKAVFGVYPCVRLNSFGADFAEKGDVVRVTTKITRPEKKTADGFYEENYLRSRHIFIICDYNGEMELISRGEKSYIRLLREKLSDNLTRYVGKMSVTDETLIARCMFIGDKSGITKELRQTFAAAGVSHILSVSGLHLSVLFMAVSVLLGLGKRDPRRRFATAQAITCIIVPFYMLLAEFTPSVMRAGFMVIIMNIRSIVIFCKRKLGSQDFSYSDEKERNADDRLNRLLEYDGELAPLNALFLAGALICILFPYSVFDVGMQLSFLSTLGILISFSVFKDVFRKIKLAALRFLFTSLCVTFSAVSFTVPICIYNFGGLSTMCAISNIFMIPLMTPLLVLLLALALLSLLPGLGVIASVCVGLGAVCEKLCSVCIWIAELNSSFVFSFVSAKTDVFLTAVFILCVALALYGVFICHKKVRAVGFFCVLCVYFVTSAVSFVQTATAYSRLQVNYCTVNRIPYICFFVKDTRIIADNGSSIRSDSMVKKTMGSRLYDTEDVYLIVPTANTDYKKVYFNMLLLDNKEKIDKVLVPMPTVAESIGTYRDDYLLFLEMLEKYGFEMMFYEESIRVDGAKLCVDISPEASSLTIDGVCVIYSEDFCGEYASKASGNCDSCIYFCNSFAENEDYTGDARLYLPSFLYEKADGAEKIPVRGPELLE